MSLNQTPRSERIHISIFGRTNSGKSSLINKITDQNVSLVSDIKGTTTDPVSKSMEFFPLGPAIITDTAGLDDETALGNLRTERTLQVLNTTDIALLMIDSTVGTDSFETSILREIKDRGLPYFLIINKIDLADKSAQLKIIDSFHSDTDRCIPVSTKTGENIELLKEKISHLALDVSNKLSASSGKRLLADLIETDDLVILVVPIDESAPKGRLILPQQQTIRDILDAHGICMVTQPSELSKTLVRAQSAFHQPPKMVITDSQVFGEVSRIVPKEIPLTSFSILFARYKGELSSLMTSVRQIEELKENDTLLISEGCTHHRQCGDIGSVKIPNWLQKYTGKSFQFEYSSGNSFPTELSKYRMIIHCGGCMLQEKEMKSRIARAKRQNVPIVNYGILISYLKGILERSTQMFQETLPKRNRCL